jgi:hypothetical protein
MSLMENGGRMHKHILSGRNSPESTFKKMQESSRYGSVDIDQITLQK